MNKICPFCKSEVRTLALSSLDLRVCPHCFSTFFPSDKTMTFRGAILPTTRKLWLESLKKKELKNFSGQSVLCIDHGEVLKQTKIPDYAFEGLHPTCCGMFHLTPELTVRVLERTLESFQESPASAKHHFWFIKLLDKFISKILGNNVSDDGAFDALQYNLHFKKILDGE